MVKRAFLFTIALCAVTAAAWAVVPLSGQITSQSGQPIPGANITITPTSGGPPVTFTADSEGDFVGSAPEGPVTITVSAPGFQTATTSLTITEETGIEATLTPDGSSGSSSVGLASNPFSGIPDFPGSGVGVGDGADASINADVGMGVVFCTHLYVLDDKGREHFVDYTLTAVGEENEKWESRAIPIPIKGNFTVRLVKEMPRETTFIDQIKLRVIEKNRGTGETVEFDLEGLAALKNRSNENLVTAFRNDGNHIPIRSSDVPAPGTRWGVKRGDVLEVTFKVPAQRPGYERTYHVMTLGYHVKDIVAPR